MAECDTFKIDLAANRFGVCYCGSKQSEHSAAALGGDGPLKPIGKKSKGGIAARIAAMKAKASSAPPLRMTPAPS